MVAFQRKKRAMPRDVPTPRPCYVDHHPQTLVSGPPETDPALWTPRAVEGEPRRTIGEHLERCVQGRVWDTHHHRVIQPRVKMGTIFLKCPGANFGTFWEILEILRKVHVLLNVHVCVQCLVCIP